MGATGDPEPIGQQLLAAYSEPHRAYHNLTHLHECLTILDASDAEPSEARIVEVALWFHDAVYNPQAADNEEQSADLANQALQAAEISPSQVEVIHRLILATKTHESRGEAAADLMLDVDLSILGSAPSRFSEYDRQIRQEYAWVPREMFVPKRIAVLDGFLQRPRLFRLPWFHDRLEFRARANLRGAIQLLQAR